MGRSAYALKGRNLIPEAQLAVKMTVAASLGWWLASLAGASRPIFASFVGLTAMSGDPFGSFGATLARILGVFAGVGIGIAVLQLDLGLLWLVAIGVLIGTLVGVALRVGDRVNVQPAISVLFLVGVGRSSAFDAGVVRVWETAIGAGVTLIVAVFLWPPHPVNELRVRRDRLRRELADDLAVVAEDLATGSGATAARMDDIRAHSLDAVREVFALDQARRALRLNPLRRRHAAEVDELEGSIQLAARLYRHARSIARDVADRPMQNEGLAAATREIGEAIGLALRGEDATAAIAAAEDRLAEVERADGGAALVVATVLRQVLADLEEARRQRDVVYSESKTYLPR
ncbi:MAG: hypothetical protein JWO17_1201 [Actinomycetia bacterium]|nr:hypothetical protein [Actinomycetes bacterium]